MTPIERQILNNQYAIISYLLNYEQKENVLRKQISNTFDLLSPKGAEEDACDMEEVQGIITRAVKGIRSPNKEEAKVFDKWYNKQFASSREEVKNG